MRLVCDETQARAIADLIVEMFDPADAAASAFELEENTQDWKSGDWIVEAYFGDPPDEDYVRSLVETVAGADAAKAVVFSVHGSHDRGKAAPNDIALEIEAALAFGTGHHGTTRGCLLMLDWVLKRRRPKDILDVGTGTGVLALAAARALRQPIMAGDIDPIAVEAPKANAVLNGARPWVEAFTARGVLHPSLRMSGPYDLIFANILARPLRQMAPDIAAVATDNAEIILSGLLSRDVPGVLSSYGAQGFALVRRIDLEGWATLLMRIGGPKPTKRPFVRKAHWPP